jgi:hypothetical protein
MTEIVTVSASTAAYATEGLKPSARISGATQSADSTYLQAREAQAADNRRRAKTMDVVGPPAIAVFFLTAGERNRNLEQATRRQAEEAYLFGKEEVEEARGDAGERQNGEEQASQEEDNEEFHEEQTEVLALPAPEDFE